MKPVRFNPRPKLLAALAVFVFLPAVQPQKCDAQQPRAVPQQDYFLSFNPYYRGDYETAFRAFRASAGGGIRSSEGRWVDSICYHTMVGECLYNIGDLGGAIERYNAALNLYLANRDWMASVEFPATVEASNSVNRVNITWGTPRNGIRVARIPDVLSSLQGNLNPRQTLQQGGVVAPPELRPMHVSEIVRCTTIAMARRREILGPTCQLDALSASVLNAMTALPGPRNHWSIAWSRVQLGAAYAAAGRFKEAEQQYLQGATVGSGFQHRLTPIALLEAGKLMLEQGRIAPAGNTLLEASYSAAVFEQYDVMEEALRHASIAHMTANKRNVFPPLLAAAEWARTRGSASLLVSLQLLLGENSAATGNTAAAATALGLADRAISRSSMQAGYHGARHQYLTALVKYQAGDTRQGNTAFAAAMANHRNSSKRLYQVSLADKLYTSGTISSRVADQLYQMLLSDPGPRDWALDPLEAFVLLTTPHAIPLEHWFDIALERRENEKAVAITDLIRRRRFHSTLDAGGRLLALRRLLAAPVASLSENERNMRGDYLGRYPAFAELNRRSETLEGELRLLPLSPAESDGVKQQQQILKQLAQVSQSQERVIRSIALQREAVPFEFPPVRLLPEVQAEMGDKQLVLSFLATSRYVHVHAIARDKMFQWRIAAPAAVKQNLMTMLKSMGHHDANHMLDDKALDSIAWVTPARQLLRLLTADEKYVKWEDYDELVVVPDGVLWYAPFGALPLDDAGTRLLQHELNVRFAPTISLATRSQKRPSPVSRTGVVAGRLFPRDDNDITLAAMQDVKERLEGVEQIPERLPGPSSLFSATIDRLLVLDEVKDKTIEPYGLSPMQSDRGHPGSLLGDWIALPYSGPQQIALPGMHTPAEDSLRKGGNGNEIFVTVCGLMATGARTILLSRWRVGGQCTHEITREFIKELPHSPAAEAWRRSVLLLGDHRLDMDREPRLRVSKDKRRFADHPFFWSGYLLVDTGIDPDMPAPEKPAKPAAPAAAAAAAE